MRNLVWLLIFQSPMVWGQVQSFVSTSEKVERYDLGAIDLRKPNSLSFCGYNDNNPVFVNHDIRKRQTLLYEFLPDRSLSSFGYAEDQIDNRRLHWFSVKGHLVFNTGTFFTTPDFSDDGYSLLYIRSGNTKVKFDSVYNSAKKIHSSFSPDGKLLLVNTLSPLSDHYIPEQDDRIIVYHLDELQKSIIKRESIPCVHCSGSYLIGDQLFFMKANKRDAYSGFSNTEIYRAPWGQVNDTTRIASNSKIVAISPDGKYILATRFFDLQKNTCVIIDVEKKKYQLLLGRDYAKAQAFYSYHEKKFAFDFGGWIVYVDYPKNYPFDALKWRNDGIPDFTDKAFWSQYEHPPFGQN